MDGGTKQTGAVAGSIALVSDKETVKAGDTFTLAVSAKDAENVNAFGKVLHYDPTKLEFVSSEQEAAVGSMENLTVNKRYEDQTAYLNLAFVNRGDQKLYSGSDRLAVITMKALADVKPVEEMECEGIWLIGPEFDLVE